MDEYESLSHSRWECEYHVAFIPEERRKMRYGELRKYLGEIFRKLTEQKESRVEEGHLLPDQVQPAIDKNRPCRMRYFTGHSSWGSILANRGSVLASSRSSLRRLSPISRTLRASATITRGPVRSTKRLTHGECVPVSRVIRLRGMPPMIDHPSPSR